MKCESCNVAVHPAFSFAIRNNQCPACGKRIMEQQSLASFLSLQELLKESKDASPETVASIIIANFDVKQKFTTASNKNKANEANVDNSDNVAENTQEAEDIEVVEQTELNEDVDDSVMDLSQKQNSPIAEKQRLTALKRMRSDAYVEALSGNDVDFDLDATVPENKISGDQQRSQANIVNGSQGSFVRG